MDVWRLLDLETRDAFTNMAIDEAILTARIQGKVPNTLRFFKWKPSAVSIGRFQNATKEARIDDCQKQGVNVVRRITGGGAVYHDQEDEITYSVIVSEKDVGSADVFRVYRKTCKGLIEAAKILGVNADFNPGDPRQCPTVTVNSKKISGSAQAHRRGVVLQHGTLLLRVDFEKMFTFLKVPWAKTLEAVVDVAQRRITSMQQQMGRRIPLKEVHQALVKGFEKALAIELEKNVLTEYEKNLSDALRREKFATHSWNYSGKASP